MSIAYIFIVGSALVFLFIIATYANQNRTIAGSKAFIAQIICISIWSIGSLLEMLSQTEQGMLFWRNIQQIGIFLLPVACIYFAVEYTQYTKLKRFLPLMSIVPILAVILIFSDSTTHLMRIGYIVSYSPLFGKALSVQQTNLGRIFAAYNYLLVLITMVILYVFSRKVAKTLRRQVILILVATGLVFVLGFIKTAFLEGTSINVPIVIMNLPGSIILFYNLYKNNFFRVSPVAWEKVFDVVEMGIIVTDATGMIADINPFAIQLLRSPFGIEQRIDGMRMDTVFAEYPDWLTQTKQNVVGEVELHLSHPDEYFIHIRIYPLQSSKGVFLGSVSIMSDVTAVRQQEFALKTKAETDSLTGLLNRESFLLEFSVQLQKSALSGVPVSLLMMDLDKFKSINDTYGHNTGDRVLSAYADLLRKVLRNEDIVARLGGDEFVALLPGIAKREAIEIANRILLYAKGKHVPNETGTSIPLVVSIGVCDNAGNATADVILECADQAMYQAKNQSGNRALAWDAAKLNS